MKIYPRKPAEYYALPEAQAIKQAKQDDRPEREVQAQLIRGQAARRMDEGAGPGVLLHRR